MLKVTRIGYTMKNGTSRKANVLSTSDDDAIRFLQRVTKNNITTVNDVGMDAEIHAYTDDALEYIKNKTASSTEAADKSLDESPVEVQKVYMCPWCDREFEKSAGLKVHIQKTHQKQDKQEKEE